MTKIAIIAAISKDFAIGKDNKLLWRLRDDMKLFVKTTTGFAVIMGRKTFESLKGPLPKRQNIVITRRVDYHPEGVEVANSVKDAIRKVVGEKAFVIGGGLVYAECLPIADELYLSHVEDTVIDADTFFPKIEADNWTKMEEKRFEKDERNEKTFTFTHYVRKSKKIIEKPS